MAVPKGYTLSACFYRVSLFWKNSKLCFSGSVWKQEKEIMELRYGSSKPHLEVNVLTRYFHLAMAVETHWAR